MKLRKYLQRIGFEGPAAPHVTSLTALMRAHVTTVPFENLDVQLRRPVTISVAAAYRKIVEQGRGGWCFEHNGLFGWALSELGYDVTRVSAAVRHDERGHAALNNHLALLVRIPDEPATWLVDVGFGGSHFAPLPLEPHDSRHVPFDLRLERQDVDAWRFTETFAGKATSYDFRDAPADEAALAAKSDWLQSAPDSSFVLSFVAQRRTPDSHISLRGRVLSVKSAAGESSRLLDNADTFAATLANTFGLDVAEARDLWPRILARHEALFGS